MHIAAAAACSLLLIGLSASKINMEIQLWIPSPSLMHDRSTGIGIRKGKRCRKREQ
jgi:hypothetical protein